MKSSFVWIAAVLSIAWVPCARADSINLSWAECGTFGFQNRTFACDTDTGEELLLVGSFDAYSVDDFYGAIAQIGFGPQFGAAHFPDWWRFLSSPCRSSGELVVDVPTGDNFCLSPYPAAAPIEHRYDLGVSPHGWPGACLTVRIAFPPEQARALNGQSEYYAFRVRISRQRSTGDCQASCLEPLCIGLNSIELLRAQHPPMRLTAPRDRNWVHWQSSNAWSFCPPTDAYDFVYGSCDGPTSTARRTNWGSVRSIYR